MCKCTFCVPPVCVIKCRYSLTGLFTIGSTSSKRTRTMGTQVSHPTRNNLSVLLSKFTDMSSKLSKLFQSFSVGYWIEFMRVAEVGKEDGKEGR